MKEEVLPCSPLIETTNLLENSETESTEEQTENDADSKDQFFSKIIKNFTCFSIGLSIILFAIWYKSILHKTFFSLLCLFGVILCSPILMLFFIAYHQILQPLYHNDLNSSSIDPTEEI